MYIRTSQKRANPQRANAELIAMALAQAWPITQTVREEVIAQMSAIMADECQDAGVRVMAAKNLLKASEVNVDILKLAVLTSEPTEAPQVAETEDISPHLKALRGLLDARA